MTRKSTLAKRGKRKAAARARKQVQPPERKVGLFVTKELGLAIEACKEAVESIARDCRARNKRFRDLEFDLEFDKHVCMHGLARFLDATSEDVQRVTEIFDKPQFYPAGGAANSNAIRQGNLGDCWFLSALATVSCVPDLIEKICVARDEQVGIYGFIFYGDNGWKSVIIDDMLYTQTPKYEELDQGSKAIYPNGKEQYERIARRHGESLLFAKAGPQEETWVPLIEKAYAKFYGNFSHLDGGWTREAIEDITGGVATAFLTKDILEKDVFWKDELLKANKDRLFACSFSIPATVDGLKSNHAYAVLRAVECRGKRFVILRNPWGTGEWKGAWSDGSKEWTPEWIKALPELEYTFGDDGQFIMDYEDCLKTFIVIERTFLFDDSWIVSSHWFNVPLKEQPTAWTHGRVSCIVKIPARTKAVLVLSQLNTRSFLSIRQSALIIKDIAVVKKGDKMPLDIASEAHPFSCRSVNVELYLEEGEYYVYVYSRTLSRILSRKVESYSLASNWISGSRNVFSTRPLQQVIQDDLEQVQEQGDANKSTTRTLPSSEAAVPQVVEEFAAIEDEQEDVGSVKNLSSSHDEDATIHDHTGAALDAIVTRIAAEWGGWTAVLLIGCLNILALFGLTVITALRPPDERLPQETDDSDAESVTSRYSDHSHSRSRSGSPVGNRPTSPANPMSPTPADSPYPHALSVEPAEEWKELLKDEIDNVVLGLRVYTQTKDPAEILWRLAV